MRKLIKLKKFHPKAKIPTYYEEAAGFDLYPTRRTYLARSYEGVITEHKNIPIGMNVIGIKYYLGIGVQLPKDWALQIMPRSSVYKKDLVLANGVGLIDADYRGEICAIFKVALPITFDSTEDYEIISYNTTDRIDIFQTLEENPDCPAVCQGLLIPHHRADFEEVEELEKTKRGTGGFGSSDGGKNEPGTNKKY
jgi:dUTP pyrophosphatase